MTPRESRYEVLSQGLEQRVRRVMEDLDLPEKDFDDLLQECRLALYTYVSQAPDLCDATQLPVLCVQDHLIEIAVELVVDRDTLVFIPHEELDAFTIDESVNSWHDTEHSFLSQL